MPGTIASFAALESVADTPARAFARVEVHGEAAAVLDAWAFLEARAPASIYQTRAFLLPWLATLGLKAGVVPLFVLAVGADGSPAALLCLGMTRRGPLRIAGWLGGRDSNFNMPLLRPSAAWTAPEIARLLRAAARACGPAAPDAFVLPNQPFAWHGTANPLALLPHQASPSAAYGTALPADGEALFAEKLSKETRKKLRKKETKLANLGPLTHRVAVTAQEQAAIVETFLAQKNARFRAQGIASEFDAPEMRAFIETASAPAGHGIELHALGAGDRIVAVYGGASHQGQWSGMFNSFDGDEEIAKSSPGDLLLMRVMAKACTDGMGWFDLGIGEARYKAALCDEAIPLFDANLPISAKGRVYARLVTLRQAAKRRIKQDAALFALVKRLRAARAAA